MTMPGFAADASLYTSSKHYQSFLATRALPGTENVIPQLPIGFCMADCDYTETDPLLNAICKFDCLDQGGNGDGGGGGGGGGDGGESCKPGGGGCGRIPGKPGRWKTCFDRNCNDRLVRC